MAGACKEGDTQVVEQKVIWSASDVDLYLMV